MEFLGEVPRPKPSGHAASWVYAWDFPRASIHHSNPSAFPNNVTVLVFTSSDRALTGSDRKCVTFHHLGSITPVRADYVVGSKQFITALLCTVHSASIPF